MIGIELEYLNGSMYQCTSANMKLQVAMNETCDRTPHSSLHDEGGVRYLGMVNINTSEQRMSYILHV